MEKKYIHSGSANVEVFLPKAGGNGENFVYVGLNGKGYKVMRGVRVSVPGAVAEILDRSAAMRERADAFMDTEETQ